METATLLPIVLSAIALLIAIGLMLTRKQEDNTARNMLITQMATNTNEAVKTAAEARVVAVEANTKVMLITERFMNSESDKVDLNKKIEELTAEVKELKAEIRGLNTMLTAEREKTAALEQAAKS